MYVTYYKSVITIYDTHACSYYYNLTILTAPLIL